MSETDTARLAMGSNKPPLIELLREANKELLDNVTLWLGSADRAPATVADDVALANFGLIIIELNKLGKKLDAAHTTEKAPYLEGSRDCDTVFLTLIKQIVATKKTLETRQSVYLVTKENEKKRKAAAEAQAMRDAEAQAMRDAEREMDKGNFETVEANMDLATAAGKAAVAAERVTESKPADLVRTYGTGGNVVSSQAVWVGTIDKRADMDLNELKAQFSDADLQKAVNAFVKLGGRSLKGVTIQEARKAVNR